jgi:hypothetical protein
LNTYFHIKTNHGVSFRGYFCHSERSKESFVVIAIATARQKREINASPADIYFSGISVHKFD